jgi:hypothetical protein
MPEKNIHRQLNDPLAQELLTSKIPDGMGAGRHRRFT